MNNHEDEINKIKNEIRLKVKIAKKNIDSNYKIINSVKKRNFKQPVIWRVMRKIKNMFIRLKIYRLFKPVETLIRKIIK